MKDYLPYIVSILCAVLSLVGSVLICKKNNKNEIEKLKMEQEFELQKAQQELENKIELLNQEYALKVGTNLMENITTQATNAIFSSTAVTNEINKKNIKSICKTKRKKMQIVCVK